MLRRYARQEDLRYSCIGDLDQPAADRVAPHMNESSSTTETPLLTGISLLDSGHLDDAVAAFDKAIQHDRKQAEAFYFRSLARFRQGFYSLAQADAARAIRLRPNSADNWMARALACYHRYLVREGEDFKHGPLADDSARGLDRVVGDCSAALKLDPTRDLSFLLRGIAHHYKGQLSRALADYTQAIRLRSSFFASTDGDFQLGLAYFGRGEIQRKAGDLESAIEDFDKALRSEPRSVRYLRHRGLAYEAKGDRARAREDLISALRIDPKNAVLWEPTHERLDQQAQMASPSSAGAENTPPGAHEEPAAQPTLAAPELQRRSYMAGDPSAAPFKNYEDFRARGLLITSPNMRIYPVIGWRTTTIAIPEGEPDYNRLTAEQALTLLRALPDIRLVRSLTILDRPFSEEPWHRQGNPNWRLLGEVLGDSEIHLYRPAASENLVATLAHEWAHLLEFASPKWRRLFELVGDLETFNSGAQEGHPEPVWERWAKLGELMLRSDDPLLSPTASFYNPVRATIFSAALAERLATLPGELRSTEDKWYRWLVRWDQDSIRPQAVQALKRFADSDELERAVRAQLILDILDVK